MERLTVVGGVAVIRSTVVCVGVEAEAGRRHSFMMLLDSGFGGVAVMSVVDEVLFVYDYG